MLSLPPDWDYSLCAISKENRDAIRSTLKELQDNHYLEIEKIRGNKGYFEYNYLIYEKPYILELIDKGYISEKDTQIFYYNKLFEDDNSYKDLIQIIHYIVSRILKRDFTDEDRNRIENKFSYFKSTIINNINNINNINRLKNPIENLWDDDYDWYEECEQ